MREERPDPPGIPVRQRDGRPVLAASGDEGAQPLTPVLTPRIDPAQRGSRALHEEFTPRAANRVKISVTYICIFA
jgi:hypothetical protein